MKRTASEEEVNEVMLKVSAIITEIVFAMMIAGFHDYLSPATLAVLAIGDVILFLKTLNGLLHSVES